jgi:hypothetical protein
MNFDYDVRKLGASQVFEYKSKIVINYLIGAFMAKNVRTGGSSRCLSGGFDGHVPCALERTKEFCFSSDGSSFCVLDCILHIGNHACQAP